MVDIRRFGASLDSNDNGPSINAAIAAARASGLEVYIPAGTWKVATTIDLDSVRGLRVRGAGADEQNSRRFGSWLMWTGPVGGTVVSMDNASRSSLESFGVDGGTRDDGSGSRAASGIRLTSHTGGSGFRNRLTDVFVFRCGDACLELGGEQGNGDNLISHCNISECGTCIRQTGNQSIGNRIADRTQIGPWRTDGIEYRGGDITLDDVNLSDRDGSTQRAAIRIGREAGPQIHMSRIYCETYHDVVSYEADTQVNYRGIYPSTIRESRFYVLAQDGRTVRMIDYPRLGNLTLIANEYQVAVGGSVVAINRFAGMGEGGFPHPSITDIGSAYHNGAAPLLPDGPLRRSVQYAEIGVYGGFCTSEPNGTCQSR